MRFKLTVWYSSLLLVFGIAFVVALNVAVRLDRPQLKVLESIQFERVETGPGRAVDRPVRINFKDFEDELFAQNLDNLRTWSILSVIGLALASGVGGYVLSGMMLRPVRDITEVASQISASRLNRRINHQGPPDELKALADTFDSMIDRLQHSFDQQRQFVQNASHELRTPLAAIRTNIEVTEMDPEVSPEEYRTLLDTVKTQTERLTRLSEDLLLLSTTEGEPQDLEPVSAVRVLREVVSQLSPTAAGRNVTLRIEGDESLAAEANPDHLFRSLFNLVENAIKYSGAGSTVVGRVSRDAVNLSVAVQDNGAGIPGDQLAHVFDRFYRVDKGRSRREGGSGLGLAIVKELVEGMGGSVAVDSAEGAGSTFTVTLPAAVETFEPIRAVKPEVLLPG